MKKTVKLFSLILAIATAACAFTGCSESLQKKKRNEAYEKYDRTGERYDYYLPDYVDVCDYAGIEIPDISYAPSEEDIENKKMIMAQYYCPSIEEPGRPCQKGDVVSIITTCKFKDTGEIYGLFNFSDRGDGEGEALALGCGYFGFPELDDAIIGMSTGETKKVTVTLPDPFYKDYLNSGKELEMEITLCWTDEIDYSVADDEFFNKHYGYYGDNLREYIIQELRSEVEEQIEDYEDALAWEYICNNSKLIKIPEKEQQEIYNGLLNSTRNEAQADELTLLEYVQENYGFETLDEFYAYLEEQSNQYCYEDMIFYYIMRCENLTSDDKENSAKFDAFYEEKCLELAEPYQLTNFADAESFLIYYYGVDGLNETILEMYTKHWVAENAVLREDINQVYSDKLNK